MPRMSTPRMAMLRKHYHAIGILGGWPFYKFRQLCDVLDCTPEELAAMCAVFSRGAVDAWERRGKVPPHIALHLHAIRATILHTQGVAELSPIPIEKMGFAQE